MPDRYFCLEWVSAAKAGNQQAITDLYTCAWQEVSIVIRSMLRTDEATVQDLVQDTFVKAFQRLDQLDDPQKYKAWVKQIARNTTLDHLKKSKEVLFSELHDDDSISIEIEDEDLSHLPDVVLDKQESARLLHEILDSLPQMQRTVISMHYLQEIPIKEIAALLDRSENTIKVQLHKGRNNLELKIRELEQKEGIKLYSLSPLPFLLLLLRNMETTPDMATLGNILESATTAGSAAAGTAAATGSAAKAAGGIAVKKIAAGILTAATLAGGIAVYSSVTKLPEYPKKDLFAEDFRVEFIGENGVGVSFLLFFIPVLFCQYPFIGSVFNTLIAGETFSKLLNFLSVRATAIAA
jgi:RNA polymerase sigma factor (sigma-70 family)